MLKENCQVTIKSLYCKKLVYFICNAKSSNSDFAYKVE